jgi:hypothetical protein
MEILSLIISFYIYHIKIALKMRKMALYQLKQLKLVPGGAYPYSLTSKIHCSTL